MYVNMHMRDDPEVSDLKVNNMSIKEIKEKLKELNITTKLRKIEKLRDILKQHLGAQNTKVLKTVLKK